MTNNTFWSNDPTILFQKEYIFELWPTPSMNYEQKLNAITRLIIIITILGYILTFSIRILMVGMFTILAIFLLFQFRKSKITNNNLKEGFSLNNDENYINQVKYYNKSITNPVTLETVLKTQFKEGNKKNPFSNPLLTEILDDPDRNAAPPAFNPEVDADIRKNVKKSVQYMNPEIKNSNKQLFSDLADNFDLDQSNRAFYSMPNTRVVNDQGAFSQYLYGGMISAKDGNAQALIQDNPRYNLY